VSAAAAPAGTAPAGTIDWHNHWFSKRSVTYLEKRTAAPQIVQTVDGRLAFVSSSGTSSPRLTLAPEFTDVDARIEHLDKVGVSRQIISWPTTLGVDALLTADEAKPLWSEYNEDLGSLVKQYPDRFSGLAALPTSDVDWAAQELERAHRELGLIGAVLPVGAFQTLEGAKHLTPIFDVAQKYGSHIYLHTGPASASIPGQSSLHAPPNDAPDIRATLDRSASFTQGAITLTQTAFLDPYPNVTLQIAMLGGSVSYLSSWLAIYGKQTDGGNALAKLRRIYYDSGVYGRAPHTVTFASAAIGADRILFGSDFPLAPTDHTTSVINKSTLTSKEKNQIFVSNGHELFDAIGKKATTA
jgi:predicted TIM-barrel fold metal-dependent hydrolase